MKMVFPQGVKDDATGKEMYRAGGLSFRELASIEIAAQMSGAVTFSNLEDIKKGKNLAAIPTIAVQIAEYLEMVLMGDGTPERLASMAKPAADDPGGKKARSLIILGKEK